MLVVTELDDPFLPLPDDLLVNLRESRALVEDLLDALPGGYSSNTPNDCAMGPALQVGCTGDTHVLVSSAAGVLCCVCVHEVVHTNAKQWCGVCRQGGVQRPR